MIRPEDDDERVPILRRRLQITGELKDGGGSSYGYDSALEDAVKAFQQSHGLRVSGRVDKITLAAMNVPAQARVDQLKLNLGRIRELMAGRIEDRYILVNAAGILRDRPLLRMDAGDFRAVYETHVLGSFLLTQAVARLMIPGGGGRIVLFTSVAGIRGNAGQANSAAADAGVLGFARTTAIELQRHKIFVNAIAPIAKTRLTADLPLFENVDSMTPAHVAPVAVYFASDLAGDKTGHVVAVAGSQLYAFKILQTSGRFKDGGTPWTPEEIAMHFDAIMTATPGPGGRRGL